MVIQSRGPIRTGVSRGRRNHFPPTHTPTAPFESGGNRFYEKGRSCVSRPSLPDQTLARGLLPYQ